MNVIVDFSMIVKANYFICKRAFGEIKIDRFIEHIDTNLSNIKISLQQQGVKDIGRMTLAIDSKHYFRKDIYPDYKGNRVKDEEYTKILNQVIEGISDDDYLKSTQEGLEADDVIALHSRLLNDVVIVSRDADLQQCGKSMFDPQKKEWIDYSWTYEDSIKKVLIGCAGDNVPKLIPRWSKKINIKSSEYDLFFLSDIVEIYDENNFISYNISLKDFQRNFELVIFNDSTYKKYGF